jgi:glycosyltransferase involved in cell wall biosynthesis
VGLPVFNGERTVKRTLDSVLAQDYQNFELIVSDNASTDRTRQICEEYAARDSRIRYHRNPENIGALRNFHRAFELSRGELFAWVAHDDEWARQYLSSSVALLVNEPDVVLAHGQFRVIEKDGSVSLLTGILTRDASMEERFHQILYQRWAILAIYGLIRSSALRKTRMFLPLLASDFVLLAELSMHGRFGEVPEPLFTYHPSLYQDGYYDRVRRSLQIEQQLAARYFPWVRIGAEFVRVALQSPTDASARVRMAANALHWIGVSSAAIPVARRVFSQMIGRERFERTVTQLHRYRLYRRLRGLEKESGVAGGAQR